MFHNLVQGVLCSAFLILLVEYNYNMCDLYGFNCLKKLVKIVPGFFVVLKYKA